MSISPEQKFMLLAIEQANLARTNGDYAIGAVIVKEGVVIAASGNRIKLDNDPTHHAEIVAIREAAKTLKNRHLENCILYTTHEPCPMCATAAVLAKMKGIVSGARIEDMEYFRKANENHDWSWRTFNLATDTVLETGDPKLVHISAFMRDECKKLFHT